MKQIMHSYNTVSAIGEVNQLKRGGSNAGDPAGVDLRAAL